MKCDHIRTRKQGDTPFFPNMLNNGIVEVCLKEDVDAAITELKEFAEDACLERDDNQTAIDELQAENAELKVKLENVQASMYCDVVDANMKTRRLQRALYKTCANWAHFAVAFFSSYVTKAKWRKMERKCLKKAEEYK